MRFSFAASALLFTAIASTSALPTSTGGFDTNILIRRAGPSGEVVEPVGGLDYKVGDRFTVEYKRYVSEDIFTDRISLTLKSYDGTKTPYNAVS